jgi:hypothetical protein
MKFVMVNLLCLSFPPLADNVLIWVGTYHLKMMDVLGHALDTHATHLPVDWLHLKYDMRSPRDM